MVILFQLSLADTIVRLRVVAVDHVIGNGSRRDLGQWKAAVGFFLWVDSVCGAAKSPCTCCVQ